MDILAIASQWAKDEIFSSKLFIVAGVIFLVISIGFWQLGKTEIARAYIVPFAVCSALLLIIFIDKPMWRAACVTTIAFLITLLVVDSNSHSRIVEYDKALKEVRSE
ncbi:MAG: hypothetical protein SNJ29_14460 [Rikenellaceae bacterium]